MLAIVRSLAPSVPASRSFYSTVSGLVRRNWRTSGHPAPQPVSADHQAIYAEDDDDAGEHRLRRRRIKASSEYEIREHRKALQKAFPGGWLPPRKLSREAMDGLRAMHALDPETFDTPALANKFRISPEGVRRILKSSWEPTREQRARFAKRERRNRQEWIAKRRAEEREKQKELERLYGRERPKDDRLTLV